MIQSYTIVITEIDDERDAIAEAREQLSHISLLKNTIGIVTTHPEFIFSGVYSAVSKIIPFPIVGATTVTQSVNGQVDPYLLSILVLTSDDCEFSYGYSEPIPNAEDVGALTTKQYMDLCGKLSGKNRLTLLYVPIFTTNYPYQYISALSAIDPQVPVFGMVANDDKDGSIYNNNSRTLVNGQLFEDRIVMLLISGNVSSKFYIGSLTEESIIFSRFGEVTLAKENKLYEINGINAVNFFRKVGSKMGDQGNVGILSTTFLMDLSQDGVLISRTPLLVEEDGIICAGDVPTGSVLSLASSTFDVVLQTAKNVAEEINKNHTDGTLLIYSCIGRRYSLLGEPLKEFELLRESLSEGYTYVAAYASGELCPTSVTETKANNHEHNQTLIVCVLS